MVFNECKELCVLEKVWKNASITPRLITVMLAFTKKDGGDAIQVTDTGQCTAAGMTKSQIPAIQLYRRLLPE